MPFGKSVVGWRRVGVRGGIIRRGGMMVCLWMFIRGWWGRGVGEIVCGGRLGGLLEEGERVWESGV